MQIRIGIIFILLNFLVSAQEPKYFSFGFEQFNGTDIYDAIQDDEGNYYFASNHGLFLHDGYSFAKLSSPEMKSLSLFNLRKDQQGNIYCYNLKNQLFQIRDKKINLFYEIPKAEQHRYLYLELVKDSVHLFAESLFEFDDQGKGNKIPVDFGPGKMRIAYHVLSDGSSVGLSQKQLLYLNSGRETQGPIETDKDSVVVFSSWINIGEETYAIDRKRMGVYRFNKASTKFEFKKYLNCPTLLNSAIRTYKVKNQIWVVGHQNGAFVFDENWNPLYSGKSVFQNYFISDIYEDREGNILLSTLGEGVLVIPDLRMKSIRLNKKEGLISLCTDGQKNQFIATAEGNIYSYSSSTNSLIKIYKSPIKKPVDYIAFWQQQNLLVFTTPSGFSLAKWDGESLNILKELNGSIKDAVFNDSTALLALNTGVYRLLFKEDKFEMNVYLKDKIRSFSIEDYTKSKSIILNSAEGIFSVDQSKNKKEILYKGKKFISTCIKTDKDLLFIGTAFHGILVFKAGTFLRQINVPEAVLDVCPNGSKIFVRCSHEIYVYDTSMSELSALTPRLGLGRKAIKDLDFEDKNIIICYSNEIAIIPEELISNETPDVAIEITGLKINGKYAKKGELPYGSNLFTFNFKVNTLRHRKNIQYRYRLRGYDNKWRKLVYENNFVLYQGLPAGDYVFQVQSINGSKLGNIASYKLNIKAPYYQKLWFYLLLVVLIALLFYLLFRWRLSLIKRKNKEILKQQELKTDLLNMELKALRSQMNPHFIFNSLNSIQHLVLKEDTDNSYDYLVLFAKLVRSTLNYSDLNFININDELEFLKVYIELEKLRFKEDFTCTLNYEGDDEIKVPPLIIQPFIENALVHGLLHKEGERKLDINLSLQEGYLECIIEDNGIGREKAKEINERRGAKHQSFAMTAMEQRIALMNQHLNTQLGKFELIDLYEDGKAIGTRVELLLPVIHSY
jgi:hypothetical protein